MANSDFLTRLQAEASLQAQLHERRVLPPQLDFLTSFIGTHTWQVLLTLSLITSVAIEAIKWLEQI